MEKLDLYRLGLFLEEEIVLIPEEAEEILKKEKLKEKFSADEASLSEGPTASSLEEAVSPEYAEEIPETENEMEIPFEGDFERGLLVIYQGPELDMEQRNFLTKVLGAVSYSLKDIALVSSSDLNTSSTDPLQKLSPNKLLVFGQINHPVSQYKKSNYEMINEEGIEYLFADDLVSISEDKSLKKKLWESLQLFFNVKK